MRAALKRPALSIALCLLGLGASACSDAIDVFGSAELQRSDAGGEAQAARGDASTAPQRSDAGGPPTSPQQDAGKPPRVDTGEPQVPCSERCAADQICALDRCVDENEVHTIALSFAHACEVGHGQLFCWGDNRNAQLGVGDTQLRDRRTRVGTWNDWLTAATGEEHSCAIRAPGRLYCWGDNTSGQLGVGDTNPRAEPAAVGDSERWQTLACGGDDCCGLQAGGALYCWGDNREGKIGQADAVRSPDVPEPTRVAPDMHFRSVAVGQGHVCAIEMSGALYCWGRNSDLELGIGRADPVQLRSPTRIGDADDWREVALSQHHTCGVRDDGSLWCWGTNAFFELSAPAQIMSSASPLRVGMDGDWQSVGAGWFHTCAIKRDGRLLCFGRAVEGQLGQGQRDEPLEMPGLVEMPGRWQSIALGNFATCGIDDSSALYCWGAGAVGNPGQGGDGRTYLPTRLP